MRSWHVVQEICEMKSKNEIVRVQDEIVTSCQQSPLSDKKENKDNKNNDYKDDNTNDNKDDNKNDNKS